MFIQVTPSYNEIQVVNIMQCQSEENVHVNLFLITNACSIIY